MQTPSLVTNPHAFILVQVWVLKRSSARLHPTDADSLACCKPSRIYSGTLVCFLSHADYKHGNPGQHWNYSAEQVVVAVTKVKGSMEWVFQPPYVPDRSDEFAFDNCYYCPPLMGPNRVQFNTPDGTVANPYQKPQILYSHLVQRFSTKDSVIAEFTGGSGTLAAACANTRSLRDRTGALT